MVVYRVVVVRGSQSRIIVAVTTGLAMQEQALLTRELDHRAKNALAVVQAALRLTPRDDPDAFARAVQGRVAALTRAHTLLAEGGWTGAELRAVLQGELDPFLSNAAQVVLEGPAVMLAAVAAQPIAMAVHELATNALKYGALSTSQGRVTVTCRMGVEGEVALDWVEAGGPPVAGPPTRRGFGMRLLERALARDLGAGAGVELRFEPGGVRATIRFSPPRTEAA